MRVFGDGHAKINLAGRDRRPELIWADNMTRVEVREAMRIVTEQRSLLRKLWEDIHGRIV
jgi:hypothetical protein